MLDMKITKEMTDIIHITIPLSGIESAVISTPIYNRLHRVLQSSLVYLTYPSNKVKRFEHSIGVMHLAGSIFFNSICNSSEQDIALFMSDINTELIKWRNNLNFSKYSFVGAALRCRYLSDQVLNIPVPKSKFYDKFTPGNLKSDQKLAYYVALQSIRLAGLMHDVGHLPYSHILEHALKKMYFYVKNELDNGKKTDVHLEFLNIMQRFVEGDDDIHEEIGKLLVCNIRDSITDSIINRSDPENYFLLICFDFAEKIMCSKFSDDTIYSDLHLITSGIIDADRLDYCSRDSFCSGITKSIFPYERLIGSYKLNIVNDDDARTGRRKRYYFSPSYKSIPHIEDLLRMRKTIFSEINFHHRVHKHEILLEEVIFTLGLNELNNMETIEELPRTLPLQVSSIWKLISKISASNDWPEYQIIQLDDSWLDTLLKHSFFDGWGEGYLNVEENGNNKDWNRFDELISAKKHYHSLLKRMDDFREFDKLFFQKQLTSTCFKTQVTDFDVKSYNEFHEKYHSFIFNYCIEAICITDTHKNEFFTLFENEINELVKNMSLNINDCLLRSCMFSFGYKTAKTPLYISSKDKESVRIEKVSTQLETFQKERALSPIFHLYYLPTYDSKKGAYNTVNQNEFMDVLASAAINTVINFKNSIDKQNFS